MYKPSLTKHHTKSTEAQSPFQPFYIAQMTDDVIKMEAGSVAGYILLYIRIMESYQLHCMACWIDNVWWTGCQEQVWW